MESEQEKQELIAYCEKSISALTQNIEAFKKLGEDPHGVIALLEMSRKVEQIALASLKAEPGLWEIINPGEGTFYSPHEPRDFEEVDTLWFKVSPTQTLKLPPELEEHKSGLFGHRPTLTLQTPDWANGYNEAIMDVKLINEVHYG